MAMRPQLLGIGPLLPRIEAGLSISHTVAGLPVTVPIACSGLLAPVAVLVRNRIGWRRGVRWWARARRDPVHAGPVERPPRLPLRSGIAWMLVALFTVLAGAFFGLNAWLPDAYVEHGWSEASAGSLIGVLNLVQIP